MLLPRGPSAATPPTRTARRKAHVDTDGKRARSNLAGPSLRGVEGHLSRPAPLVAGRREGEAGARGSPESLLASLAPGESPWPHHRLHTSREERLRDGVRFPGEGAPDRHLPGSPASSGSRGAVRGELPSPGDGGSGRAGAGGQDPHATAGDPRSGPLRGVHGSSTL